ncbi:hypothetical protein QFZ87_003429 [Bacillus sp. SLBN-46]|jgi:hypothetical protein|uniref:hypothetical protein n=1 Tax=Bacillus sp. SLBN-46 TaxID=3042283 RepID=UPI00285CF5C1|nr:hypothetical protein [Bacillus sp. SLBN-46]MDR6123832.1 hypothetical protein [Bacillus sp. SLBN-46]
MSYWITVFVLFIVLYLVVEELIYYFWNRYVYGPNLERKSKWKKKISTIWKVMTTILTFFKKKRPIEIQEANEEKNSM